ncbi:hypothetical protein TanjilG_16001 [Lupinus angustifolius]|uniref:Uncharacterized protein n=1 Tax=Lupinus angustifolius TaxID=3871 RepID=A0A4P1RHK9_LUPAN|nr:hypothetical protein TanjilG_16001 [Lupinus angustifolius]
MLDVKAMTVWNPKPGWYVCAMLPFILDGYAGDRSYTILNANITSSVVEGGDSMP